MFLSKFLLDINNREIKNCLQDYNKLHKLTWKFFNTDSNLCLSRSNMGILYRIVYLENNVYLYLQSKFEPVIEIVGVTKIYIVNSNILLEKFKEKEIVNFNMLVNPIIQENKKRRFLVSIKERDYWLKKYSSKNGFEFLNYSEISTISVKIVKDREFFIKGVEYQGQIRITNFLKFINIYSQGIGAEKSYGMGLLLLS